MLTHISGVYISDSLIDGEDLRALKDIVATLEDVPNKQKDWHPGSDGQVLDLLHPSLHPYVRGRTPRYVPEVTFELADDASLIERLSVGILRGCGTLPIRHSYASPEAALTSFGEGVPTTDDSARKDTIELSWPREPVPEDQSDLFGKSIAYQWLPTDVSLSIPTSEPATFPTVRFLSYINNLHPRSATRKEKMYPILERLFAKFIPMFGRTISRWEDEPSPAVPEQDYLDNTTSDDDDGSEDENEGEEVDNENEHGEGEKEDDMDKQGEVEDNEDEQHGVESADDEQRKAEGTEGNKKEGEEMDTDSADESGADKDGNSSISDVGPGTSNLENHIIAPSVIEETEQDPNTQTYEFKESEQLQVVIKLANIHLTSDKPDYPGGSWHVEGTDTERICATGIYYFDSENITPSKLSFRVAVENPDGNEHLDGRVSNLVLKYGIDVDGPANQFLGSVVTQQGRCICFPNNMQHRVEPFSLADPTKPGHRKILAFFLIHPHNRVLSTSDVPPQQFEWFASEIRIGQSRLAKLPKEVFGLIMEQAAAMATEDGYPWPMPWKEALKHRELLMAERGRFTVHANGEVYESDFSLCEH